MVKIVPVKNIDKILVDVRKPNFNYERLSAHVHLDLRRVSARSSKRLSRPRLVFLGAAAFLSALLIFLGTVFYGVLGDGKSFIKNKGETIAANFSIAAGAVKEFKPELAIEYLEKNSAEIESVTSAIKKYRGELIAQTAGSVVPFLKEAGTLVKTVAAINSNFLDLAELLRDLKENGFNFFMNEGGKLLEILGDARSVIHDLLVNSRSLKNATANLKNISSFFGGVNENLGGIYLKRSADLYKLDKAVERIIALIGSEKERRLLLFFQNPAEIRPAGGFIGSYADLAVKNGQMTNLDVRDIYDPDGQFFLKVVPPEPLQGIVTKWAARDANWFFDFPTSAKTVSAFLEASKIYEESRVAFDGAIAVNINVLESILKIVGSIPMEDYELVISSDNFLREIQREVEAGEDKTKGHPKRILQVLTPVILERLKNLDKDERSELFDILRRHIAKKDIMFYVEDTELASFLREAGVDGSVYDLPSNFWGSYLGVVNANVAGGKSDAFVFQSIESRINIDTDGGILTDVIIKREHRGNKEKDPWWRATNKNFIQIFTNPASNLLSLSGNQAKKSAPRVDYATDFEFNPDLEKIELTKKFLAGMNAWIMEAFGKTVFGAWTSTQAGKTTTLNLRYQLSDTGKIEISPGKKFIFIFEKQSGAKTTLRVNIAAPLSYVWADSGEPFYTYENENPDGRIIINLTLTK